LQRRSASGQMGLVSRGEFMKRIFVAWGVVGVLSMSSSGSAQPSQERVELLQMIRALQARVSELETQVGNTKLNPENTRPIAPPAGAQVAATTPRGRFEPTSGASEVVVPPPPQRGASWSGLYWGASFGGGLR